MELQFSAKLSNGDSLPAWLGFDSATRTFSGTPTSTAAGLWTVRVTATDLASASVSDDFVLDIANHLLGTAGADNLVGSGLRDVIESGAGNDSLNGGAGADTLNGGGGADTYYVDDVGDTIIELGDGSWNMVNSSVSYTLSDTFFGQLQLTGTANLTGTGNASANWIYGNSGNNTLTGLAGNDYLVGYAGADTLIGGFGNDLYDVDNIGDVIVEAAGEGTDTVWTSSIDYTLGDNVENLKFFGSANRKATGNALANTLTGNSGANIIDGGAGGDTLLGGTGNDSYLFGAGYGSDTIRENDATVGNTDVAQFQAGITADQIWLQHVGNNLEASIIGTTDKLTMENWYLGSSYHVEQFKTADGKLLLDSQVENLVQAMAAFAPPAAGQTTLPPTYQDSLAPVIAANWQ